VAELSERLARTLLPEGAGPLQAALAGIAALLEREDLSKDERLAEIGKLVRARLSGGSGR
jgi:hypothetical protein